MIPNTTSTTPRTISTMPINVNTLSFFSMHHADGFAQCACILSLSSSHFTS